jgi:hypothetical protein
VGTVDKFQGREAPVVFYSMATSSAEDVPRSSPLASWELARPLLGASALSFDKTPSGAQVVDPFDLVRDLLLQIASDLPTLTRRLKELGAR